jgi:hypothetical protein
MIKTGAIIFDTESPGSGWVCEAGGDPFRMASIRTLPTDTVWLVSAGYDEMNEAGLAGHAFYRNDSFLRLKFSVIATEFGLYDDQSYFLPDVAAAKVAVIFERLVRLFCVVAGVSREHWKPHPFGLKNAIREMALPPDPVVDPLLHEATLESVQEFTRSLSRPSFGSHLVALSLPRVEHARQVLSTMVPATDRFKRVKPPKGLAGASLSSWVIEQGGPILARTTLSNFEQQIGDVSNFGGIAPKVRKGAAFSLQYTTTRQWLTGEELVLYSGSADVDVHEAIVFERHARLIDLPHVRDLFSRVSEIDHLSYSLGLFFDNLWTGLVSSYATGPSRDRAVNLIAPFLRSVDRIHCMSAAIRVSDQGHTVSGFGAGRVHLWLEKKELMQGEAVKVAALAGLIPPMLKYGSEGIVVPTTLREDDGYTTHISLISEQFRDELESVDSETVGAITADATA